MIKLQEVRNKTLNLMLNIGLTPPSLVQFTYTAETISFFRTGTVQSILLAYGISVQLPF